jgi:di/tricarboxylate transporter
MMTAENILVLAILAGAVVLFVSEKLRVDLIALLVLITLSLTGLVTIE